MATDADQPNLDAYTGVFEFRKRLVEQPSMLLDLWADRFDESDCCFHDPPCPLVVRFLRFLQRTHQPLFHDGRSEADKLREQGAEDHFENKTALKRVG
jgi:hypothetical protein